jgi:hypothetical protein
MGWMSESEKRQTSEKPVSLHPLPFDEAMSDLLKVTPPAKEGKPSRGKRRRPAPKRKRAG